MGIVPAQNSGVNPLRITRFIGLSRKSFRFYHSRGDRAWMYRLARASQ
mgnify:CR=1 FL=1